MNELEEQKLKAIYQLLLAFMISDWEIEQEEEEVLFDFMVNNFNLIDKRSLSLEMNIEEMTKDEEIFMENMISLKLSTTKDELKNILLFISEIAFADWNFEDQEYALFKKLMDFWWFKNEDLKN